MRGLRKREMRGSSQVMERVRKSSHSLEHVHTSSKEPSHISKELNCLAFEAWLLHKKEQTYNCNPTMGIWLFAKSSLQGVFAPF